MKKIIIFPLLLIMFCLTGCQKTESESGTTNQEPPLLEERSTESGNVDKIDENELQLTDTSESESQENMELDEESIGLDNDGDSIEKVKKYMIPEQSFDITLDDWGEVTFVSCKPTYTIAQEYASFYLVRDDQILYKFPYRYEENVGGSSGSFQSVGAVGFRDINDDGKDDIIVISYYVSGAGPTGMVPRSDIRIFIAGENEFYLEEDMAAEALRYLAEEDTTIDNIYNFLRYKN